MKVTFEEVCQLVSQTFECDVSLLTLESGLGHHYSWDSLGHVTLMVAIEEKYNVIIDETNIADLRNIEQILNFLNVG
jgi:acyl carrier protein